MTTEDHQFSLPRKLDSYLRMLSHRYDRPESTLLREIVVNGAISIHEGWEYDNWNGGTYGHAVTLTVSEELYMRLLDAKEEIRRQIAVDLNKLDSSEHEHISEVFIEMEPTDNDDWREQTGIYRSRAGTPAIAREALQRIWGKGHVRVFLSHKSTVKENTAKLKQSLSLCGITAFVAHEDIEPTEEWQREIERALFSMDALVALLSSDFHDSNWTDQEIGVAIGRGVPHIAVRLGMDPYGLMGKRQGVGGCSWSDPDGIAVQVFRLLYKRLPDKSRLFECALSAYNASSSWEDSGWKVEHLLTLFESLTSDQVTRLLGAYRTNKWNRNSFRGMDVLQPLLEKWTGKGWSVQNKELVQDVETADPEIPF